MVEAAPEGPAVTGDALPALRAPTVLHVVESYGAGVANAVEQFAWTTSELTHHLLRSFREGEYAGDESALPFASVTDLPRRSGLAAIRGVRKAVATLHPDMVHAHSSLAGLYVRLALRRSRAARIVYSPHCFAFERKDVGQLARIAFRSAEWMLALNTDVIAACSTREFRLASRMPGRVEVVYVPNVATIPESLERPTVPAIRVVTAGRIAPQKDPELFAAIATELRRCAPAIGMMWVGDGDPDLVALLRESGVQVTGWTTHTGAMEKIAGSLLYLHTARWEGFPLALLEAVRLGVVPIVRKSPAFDGVPPELLVATAHRAARRIAELADSTPDRSRALARWEAVLRDNDPAHQHDCLLEAYHLVTRVPTEQQVGRPAE